MKRPALSAAMALTSAMFAGPAMAGSNARSVALLDTQHDGTNSAADASAGATLSPAISRDQAPSAEVPQHRTFGVDFDLGVPDGAALGFVVRPHFDWLRLGASITHNGIAPGLRIGATVDPIDYPIAPTFTVEGGHYWEGALPMVQGQPSVGYDYANLHLGLEVGNRATFRFFLRAGVSYVDVSTSHFQNTAGSTAQNTPAGSAASGIGDPTFHGWLAPSGKLGFSLYF